MGHAASRAASQNNVKQIVLALHNYHDTHGRLPPAVVRDAQGKPLYSWRVLILPYLEEAKLFKQFKLDEPWDSAHNKPLLAQMPRVFAAPSVDDPKAEPYTTYYQVFVGEGTAFEGGEGLRLPDDFPNGTSSTFLVAEAGEAVPWTKPADLVYAADRPLPSLGGIFKSEGRFSLFGPNRAVGFHAAFADGSTRFIRAGVHEDWLRSAITRAGCQGLDPDN